MVQHAVGQRLLVGQRLQHAMLDRVFRDEIDDGDGAGLMFAPGAGDALFELGRIPRQIAIHDHAGVLEVQPGRAGIGAEKHAAVRVALEGVDLRAPPLLRHASRCARRNRVSARRQRSRTSSSIRSHSENTITFTPSFSRHSSKTSPTRPASGSRATFRIEDVGRVANHPHHGQVRHEPVLLLLRERTALGERRQPGTRPRGARRRPLAARLSELHEMLAVGAVGQFGFHVALAAAQHVGRDALVQPGQIRGSRWAARVRRTDKSRD